MTKIGQMQEYLPTIYKKPKKYYTFKKHFFFSFPFVTNGT